MFDIKFKAGNDVFTYTSMGFSNEIQVKEYFFNEYVPKYFPNDNIEIIKVKQY